MTLFSSFFLLFHFVASCPFLQFLRTALQHSIGLSLHNVSQFSCFSLDVSLSGRVSQNEGRIGRKGLRDGGDSLETNEIAVWGRQMLSARLNIEEEEHVQR